MYSQLWIFKPQFAEEASHVDLEGLIMTDGRGRRIACAASQAGVLGGPQGAA
jgi:hypothetical protein